jgi:hypothetical protein
MIAPTSASRSAYCRDCICQLGLYSCISGDFSLTTVTSPRNTFCHDCRREVGVAIGYLKAAPWRPARRPKGCGTLGSIGRSSGAWLGSTRHEALHHKLEARLVLERQQIHCYIYTPYIHLQHTNSIQCYQLSVRAALGYAHRPTNQ